MSSISEMCEYNEYESAYGCWLEDHVDTFIDQEKLIKEGKDAGLLHCSRTKNGLILIHDTFNAYCHRYNAYLDDKNPVKQPGLMYCNYRTEFDDEIEPSEYTLVSELNGSYHGSEPTEED